MLARLFTWRKRTKDLPSPVTEEAGLIIGMARDLDLIGGIADAKAQECASWDPRREELERIRSEVAALWTFLAEAMI